ncbi:MAG TPA: hypothetical protein VFV50_00610 [Bdellovibrionales bacterium]|nr:hypothetical protein [Bdellovibrionales bacterium]
MKNWRSLRGRRATIAFACSLFLSPFLLSDSSLNVEGTVLYSFSEPHALLQTKDFVARIILKDLSPEQIRALTSVGARARLQVPRSSIDLVWPVDPNRNEMLVIEGPKRASALLPAGGSGNRLQIDGKVLTAFGSSERLIEAGAYIYRIDSKKLPSEAAAALENGRESVSITVPAGAVIFAWRSRPEAVSPRVPASTGTDDKIAFSNGHITIAGRALASFSEPHLLVQSKGKVYLLRKKEIAPAELAKASRPGDHVTVSVPTRAIEYYWPSE